MSGTHPPLYRGRHAFAGRVAIAFLLILLPAAAGAATYYVSTTGSDANSGVSPAQAFATISKANSRVAPGDRVIVADGSYSHYPIPAVSGTESARITYIGDLANPSAVSVTGTSNSLTRNYVTVKGFLLTKGIYVSGIRDSVAWCEATGSSRLQQSADCVIAHSRFDAQRFWMLGSESDTSYMARRDTLTDCTFTLNPTDLSGHTIRLKTLESCLIRRCRFLIHVGAGAVAASPTKLFHVRDSRIEDCFWDITNDCTGSCDESGWFVLRDFTQRNVFLRDTIQMHGPGDTQFFATCSGSYPATTLDNNFDRCIIKAEGPTAYGHAFFWQDIAKSDTLTNCLFVGRDAALGFTLGMSGETVIDHCTIAAQKPWHGSAYLDIRPGINTGTLQLTNNIFYTFPSAPHQKESTAMLAVQDGVRGHVDAHHNLYYSPMKSDSSIWAGQFTKPGSTTYWCTSVGADCSGSLTGDPLFADASSVIDFDGHLLAGSPALGAGEGGADIGAYGFALPDLTEPGSITNLGSTQITDQFVSLQWTAPGDDGYTGRAQAYDLRFSTSPITEVNFTQATPWPGVPLPLTAGTVQSTIVTGLSPGLNYRFAIKARDEAGNWSRLGNVITATTHPTDYTPPADVDDLRASP